MTSHWPQIQFKLSRSFAYGMPGGSRVLQINRIRSFSVECFIIQQIWNRWKSMFRAGLRVGGATFWLVHVPLCHPPGWRIVNLVMIVLFCSGQKRYTKSSCLRADGGPDAAHGTSLNRRCRPKSFVRLLIRNCHPSLAPPLFFIFLAACSFSPLLLWFFWKETYFDDKFTESSPLVFFFCAVWFTFEKERRSRLKSIRSL